MQKLTAVGLIAFGMAAGTYFSNQLGSPAIAQMGPSTQSGGDALWHLPKFGESGWFLHANNGRVRACNMDKVSVVGERAAPRCSKWTED
jgi:hypothetical protein